MIKKWQWMYWINHFIVAANAFVFIYACSAVDTWYVMPCVIVTILSLAPVFISYLYWPVIKRVDVSAQYFNDLFVKKVSVSLPLILIIQTWSWWGGGAAILGGSIIASWLGNAVFWFVGAKDLNCVLPAVSNIGAEYGRAQIADNVFHQINSASDLPMTAGANNAYYSVNSVRRDVGVMPLISSATSTLSEVSHHEIFNPASGLPMVNSSFDCHGNVYGTTSTGSDY